MDLCQTCQAIDIRALLKSFRNSKAFAALNASSSWFPYLHDTPDFQSHHTSLAALQDARKSGCRLCAMIWTYHCRQWDRHDDDGHVADDCMCARFVGAVRFVVYMGSQSSWRSRARLVVVVMANGQPLPPVRAVKYDPWKDMPGHWLAELEISTAKGAPLPQDDLHLLEYMALDEMPSSLRSAQCLSTGLEWLEKCSQEHEECAESHQASVPLPTRVIDVGNTSTLPRLHVSEVGELGRWVALSYCWGGVSNFTLDAGSSESLRSGIPLSDLPPTLRDAVVVTRSLGVRYLWIDSLCIFQDDIEDWAAEAPKMGDVYSGAIVTLAATSADTVMDGFLDKREPHFNCPIPWRPLGTSTLTEDSSPCHVFLRAPLDGFTDQQKRDSSRWANRGWTFQEGLLSNRLLCYTTGRMIWHCQAGMDIEAAGRDNTDFSLFSQLKRAVHQSKSLDDPEASPEESLTAKTYQVWYKLVEGYTKRQLTFDKDRLPAIAAIAQSLHAQVSDQYLAGLWKGDLLYGLLWGVRSGPEGQGIPGHPLLRARLRLLGHQNHTPSRKTLNAPTPPTPSATTQNSPSWSWAGAATSPTGISWPSRPTPLTYPAQVLSVTTHPALHNDFGFVSGGELILEAPYRHLHLRLGSYARASPYSPTGAAHRALRRLGPMASTKKLVEIVLTRPEWLASTQSSRSVGDGDVELWGKGVVLLRVAEIAYGKMHVVYVLLLRRAECEGEAEAEAEAEGVRYRRVGILELQPWEYDDDNYMGEETISRLEGAAYKEVVAEEWPRGRFMII